MNKASLKNISVFHPYILVEPLEKETEKTSGAGIITSLQDENVIEAKVIASSSQTLLNSNFSQSPTNGSGGSSQHFVQKGEIIFVKKFSSYPVDETNYRFVNVEDIMGVKG